jgi:hypothetical protein
MNLNDTPSAGPLLASDLHRITVMCLPCNGDCVQGCCKATYRQAAEACTELGHEDDPYDGTAVIRGLFSALAITAILAAVVVALV